MYIYIHIQIKHIKTNIYIYVYAYTNGALKSASNTTCRGVCRGYDGQFGRDIEWGTQPFWPSGMSWWELSSSNSTVRS